MNRLLDYPIDAVYVQALRLDPVGDSPEKLAQYVRFLLAVKELRLPVIAGRVGAFGLVLQALGIAAFDSGLGQAERSDLAALNRPPTERELERRGKGGGPDRRIYLEQLKTTLQGRHAGAILADRSLRSRFVCSLGCCQHRGFEDLSERRREHYCATARWRSCASCRPRGCVAIASMSSSATPARPGGWSGEPSPSTPVTFHCSPTLIAGSPCSGST